MPAILLAAALLLAGCASAPRYKTEQLLTAAAVPAPGTEVTMSGTVGYNDHGCVVVGEHIVLVAPHGSQLIDDGIIVVAATSRHPEHRQLHVGAPVPEGFGGTEVGPHSRFVPKDASCGSGPYLLID